MGNPRRMSLFFLVAVSLIVAACGSEDDAADGDLDAGADSGTDADAGALEIIGDYHEAWGAEHHITADDWTAVLPGYEDAGPTTSIAHITSFDNAEEYLVAQNDGVLSYNPETPERPAAQRGCPVKAWSRASRVAGRGAISEPISRWRRAGRG